MSDLMHNPQWQIQDFPEGRQQPHGPTPNVATFCKICMSNQKNWDPWWGGGGCAGCVPLNPPLIRKDVESSPHNSTLFVICEFITKISRTFWVRIRWSWLYFTHYLQINKSWENADKFFALPNDVKSKYIGVCILKGFVLVFVLDVGQVIIVARCDTLYTQNVTFTLPLHLIRPQFFYLLDYITFSGISKCGDWKKKIKIKIELKPKI